MKKKQPSETYMAKLKADINNLRAFRNFIEQSSIRMLIDDEIIFDMKLVLDEVCKNIISYGYKKMQPGTINVFFDRYPDTETAIASFNM